MTADYWDETFRAGTWDYLESIAEISRYAVVAGYIHQLGGGRVLDAGCGTGPLAGFLDLARVRYSGFDISSVAIASARERRPDLTWIASSLEDFLETHAQTQAERFDILVFNEVLSTLEQPLDAFHRSLALIVPNGHVIISQFHGAGPGARAATVLEQFEPVLSNAPFERIGTTDVHDCPSGLRWRISCVHVPEQPR